MKIFWSWQSDTPGRTGRHFVRDAIAAAIKRLKEAEDIDEPSERDVLDELHLDQDRQGLPGSPDLARAILEKIDRASVVIADVTIVNKGKGTTDTSGRRLKGRRFINPNVGIELGYALKALGDERSLLVMNTHFGLSDELPFDLRHKGVSLLYNLPPDADSATIEAEKGRLVAKLVPALRHYVSAAVKEVKVEFKGWPAKRAPVFFFERDEVLATIGEPELDQVIFGMTAERAISLRLIPGNPRQQRISPRELRERVNPSLGAFWIRGGGGLATHNEYGAIVLEPQSHASDFNEAKALTQVFPTGELWGVNAYLLRDRPDAGSGVVLPALVFEKCCFDTLQRYVKFACDKLELRPPFQFQGTLAGVRNVYLWFEYDIRWGPIHQPLVTYSATLDSVADEALAAVLLRFFETVYDQTPYARPENLFGFPPGPPSEHAPVQVR